MSVRGRVLIIAITLVIVGCTNDTSATSMDQSFITDVPCSAPCWYGLEPGKSDLEETYNVLHTLSFIDQTTIRERSAFWLDDKDAKEITFDCVYVATTTAGCGGLTFYDGKLSSLWVYVGYRLTLEDAVAKLGDPNYVSYFAQPGESMECVISLYWVKQAISSSSFNAGECPTQVDSTEDRMPRSDLEITTLSYSTKDDASATTAPCDVCIPWLGFAES